jgi:hypothetical protein
MLSSVLDQTENELIPPGIPKFTKLKNTCKMFELNLNVTVLQLMF